MADRHGADRPSVVALHGWRRDSSDFRGVLAGQQALAFDLPGHGTTAPPETAWGSPEYAQLVIEALDGHAAAPVTLVGHSFGGRVAVHVAAQRPDLVGSLILTGVPLYRRSAAPATPPLAFRAARALHRRKLISDAFMDAMRDRYGSADYRATSGTMRAIFVKLVNENYDDALAAISKNGVPVQLVWGGNDTEVPVSVAERIAAAIPQAQLRVVPDSGHLIDDALTAALRDAIARSSAASR
ncbi:alpha/beta hydrolase [Mycobacterium sp. MYCO198283]|nr:alpha/beta hydrolase [Mycobacterium sp. MYCO198283]